MIHYPLQFSLKGEASAGITTSWSTSREGLPSLTSAIPPEFGGSGSGFSPEDFLLFAALNCFIATFKVFAEKSGLQFTSLSGEGTLWIDRVGKAAPGITRIDLSFILHKPSDQKKAEQLLEEAKKNCMVTNVLSVEKNVTFACEN